MDSQMLQRNTLPPSGGLAQPATCFCWFLAWFSLSSGRWRWYTPPRCLPFSDLHGIIMQKTVLFKKLNKKYLISLHWKILERQLNLCYDKQSDTITICCCYLQFRSPAVLTTVTPSIDQLDQLSYTLNHSFTVYVCTWYMMEISCCQKPRLQCQLKC